MANVRTMTLQIRANLRHGGECQSFNNSEYHDITNPGKPQTKGWGRNYRNYPVPWHYKSGQTSDHLAPFWGNLQDVPWHYKSGQTSDNAGCPVGNCKRVPWHYKSGQTSDYRDKNITLWFVCTMTLQIRANLRLTENSDWNTQKLYHYITNPGKPQTMCVETLQVDKSSTMTLQIRANLRPPFGNADACKMYHDITNPGKPQTFTEFLPEWAKSTMTLQIRANLRLVHSQVAAANAIVPWHYKSGQTSDWIEAGDAMDGNKYHDITNPGKPQTKSWNCSHLSQKSTMTLQIRANLRQIRDYNVILRGYHDITNPGKPQTGKYFNRSKYRVPWHYKSGQTSDRGFYNWFEFAQVPWHYKSGQTSDYVILGTGIDREYHDITNPGKPQTIYTWSEAHCFGVPWHYKSGQTSD